MRTPYRVAVWGPGDEPAAPGYVGFAVCLIQAIPAVVAAPPGIKPTDVPPVHHRSDIRLLSPNGAAHEYHKH